MLFYTAYMTNTNFKRIIFRWEISFEQQLKDQYKQINLFLLQFW